MKTLLKALKTSTFKGRNEKNKKQKKTNIQLFQSIMMISKRSLKFLKTNS